MRILITGGAGFIGSHLTERLLARGHRVTVVDDLSTGRSSNLDAARAAHGDRLEVLEARVSEGLAALADSRFDRIFHLAAAVGVRLVIERPIETIETNVIETAALLRYAESRRAPVLIASSSEVYGKSPNVPFREDDDVVYGPTTVTRWLYACTKAVDEYLALEHHRRHGLPVSIARFFNTVGPRQVGDYGMVLPRFVGAALDGQPLTVHGDGTQSRCFCDVRDVVEVLPELLDRPACHGRVFNVGSDRSITIGDLARLVIDTIGSRSRIEKVPYDQAYECGFEDLAVRRPDLSRIREATGWRPTIPLSRTILDLAEDLRSRRPLSGPQRTEEAPP